MKILYPVLMFIVLITGCRKDNTDNTPASTNDYFVSATSLGMFSKTALQSLAVKSGYANFAPIATFDVDFYKLIYKTTFKGNKIQVSGLIGIPKNGTAAPSLISAQHGTMFRFTDAPSNFPNSFSGYELVASAGYITLIPDFIGYGVSQNIPHPYYDQQSSGLTVVDMIKAAKYYFQQQKITTGSRLFIVGYSEGGYVTMAAQKEIETNASHGLTLTAAAEGAGGYDLNEMLTGIATASTYSAPSFLSLLLRSYDSTYNWKRPYSDFYQEPYATKLSALLDGTKDRSAIDAALSTSTAALFNPSFYASLSDPAKETVMKQQLTANSFLTWTPKSATRLYHGTADEAVFYQTSVSIFNRFKTAGATNVEFVPIPGGTHSTSIEPMMFNALPWILSLNK